MLKELKFFQNLPDEEIQWLLDHGQEVTVEPGTYFLREGEPDKRFYIVLEGEMQISRKMNGTPSVLGTTPAGIIGGEMIILNGEGYSVNSQAILPTRLLVFDEAGFRQIFANCPIAGMSILQTASGRMSGLVSQVKQQEKMAALGKLSAGLAHELNNPAAAAQRAARTLHETLPHLQRQTMTLHRFPFTEAQWGSLTALQQDTIASAGTQPPLSTLEQSDREDEIGTWLEDLDVPGAWQMAPTFVNAGVTVADLKSLTSTLPAGSTSDVLQWMCTVLTSATLLKDIEDATHRITELVKSIKEYTYMDQAPLQEVNLHQGLDSTLKMLHHKLKKGTIQVVREYDPEMPKIMGRGGELNQVWTNLIDNAIDAMQGAGTLHLITRCENNFAMVEITDTGAGIPADTLPHIFEPFFTTKEVGLGSGLGLDISYRIIRQHHGTMEVQSQPGHTRFIIRLPIEPPKEGSVQEG